MGWLNSLVEIGTLGLVDDFDGSEGAAASARAGQRDAIASQEYMQQRQQDFLTEQQDASLERIDAGTADMISAGQAAADKRATLADIGYERGETTAQNMSDLAGSPLEVNLEDDPGYQFRLQEAQKAMLAQQSASGTSQSGRSLREMGRYSSGLASQEYGAAWQRAATLRGQELDSLGNLANMQINRGLAGATNVYDESAALANSLSMSTGVTSNFTSDVNQTLASLGQSQSQYHTNMGDIGAAESTASFNSLMGLGTVAGGLMTGYGAL